MKHGIRRLLAFCTGRGTAPKDAELFGFTVERTPDEVPCDAFDLRGEVECGAQAVWRVHISEAAGADVCQRHLDAVTRGLGQP